MTEPHEWRVGRWTVSDQYTLTARGERKYLCRCDCGTERYVLERSLKSGGSLSCGCLAKENAKRKNTYELSGKKFGELTVLQIAEHQRKYGGQWWTCQCSCGNRRDFPATFLVQGKKTSCGCKTEKDYYNVDISGKSFHRLTALYPTAERSPQGSVMWHCKCICGQELDVSYNELVYSNIRSCGCQKKEHDAKMQEFLTRVSGTSLDILKSEKQFSSNTSGVKGVYFVRGKWMAKIVFQKKAYYLGFYEDFDDAVQARKEAEAVLFKGTIDYYEHWQTRAELDPFWAENNPVEIFVTQENGELSVEFSPPL